VNRRFSVERPDALWVGDVTEHGTAEGKVYLATVIDAYSRRIIGWSIADHLRAELVADALQMAIWRRHGHEENTIMNTDHGSQGEFNWPSQHLDHGGGKWRRCASASERSSCIGGRFHRWVRQRSHGARTESDSGQRSRWGPQPRRLASQPACHPPLPIGGSATLVV